MAIDDAAIPLNPLSKRMPVSRPDQAASQHRQRTRFEAPFHTTKDIHVSNDPHRAGRHRMRTRSGIADRST
jgi:hypothetical protein